MQKMPFSRLYPYLEKSRHSAILDESLQFIDHDGVELSIVKPLYNQDSEKRNHSAREPLEPSID